MVDRTIDRPEELKGLVRFARRHKLPLVWSTTRTRFAESNDPDGTKVRFWPAAAVAFHYGVRAVKGRMGDLEAKIRDDSGVGELAG